MIETERLRLRTLRLTDLPQVVDLLSDPEVMRFIGPRRAMDQSDIQAWLEDTLKENETQPGRWAIALKTNDEFIGMVGIKQIDGVNDFGYYLRRAYWGQGFASEACQAALDYIEHVLQIHDYDIFIADENIGSRKLAQQMGWQPIRKLIKEGEPGSLYK